MRVRVVLAEVSFLGGGYQIGDFYEFLQIIVFGQHIQNIASFFGTFDVSLPFAGPLSDKLERRISVLIGAASYVIFFIGIAFSPNIQVAYVAAGTSLSYAALPVADGIAIGILGVLAIFAPMLAGSFCQCEIRKSFSEDRTIKKRSLRV